MNRSKATLTFSAVFALAVGGVVPATASAAGDRTNPAANRAKAKAIGLKLLNRKHTKLHLGHKADKRPPQRRRVAARRSGSRHGPGRVYYTGGECLISPDPFWNNWSQSRAANGFWYGQADYKRFSRTWYGSCDVYKGTQHEMFEWRPGWVDWRWYATVNCPILGSCYRVR